jgi:AI-2 transport protein TqsA
MESLSIRNGSLMGCAAFVILVAGMKAASVLVVPFLLAVFLAIICTPPLFWMQKKGIPSFSGNTLNGLGGVLTNTFFVFLTFVFILSEAAGFPNKLRALSKGSDADLSRYSEITAGVNRYLGIKTLTSLVTGLAITFWLMVQGVDFPVMWGVFAFLFNYIPNIGSIIAAVPAVMLALVQLGPVPAAFAGLGFLIVNTVMGSVIEPRVMGHKIGLSALVVFLSLAFWGWVLGPVGMLLSVPLTMAVKIALGGKTSTLWLSILLGSNKEAANYLVKK